MSDILVVSGCDDNHFALATDLFSSLNDGRDGSFDTGFVNVDDGERCRTLRGSVDRYEALSSGTDGVAIRGYKTAFMKLKPRLPSIFPGYSKYIWLDGDTWVQDIKGLHNVAKAADKADIAIHPELDPHYFRQRLPSDRTLNVYPSLFPDMKLEPWRIPMVNTGVFGARADSPLWAEWVAIMDTILARHTGGEDLYLSDQIPLHYRIVTGKLAMHPLRAVDNWQLYASTPSIHEVRKKLVVPTEPYEDINIMHLAGATKDKMYNYGTSGQQINFTYSGIKKHFSGT